MQQNQADRQGRFMIAALNASDAAEADRERKELLQQVKLAEEEDRPALGEAYDDASGAPLDPEMVYKARIENVEYIRKMKLYDKVPKYECWKETGMGAHIHKMDRHQQW